MDPQAQKRDSAALLQAFDKLQTSTITTGLAIGGKTRGKVQLVKDYGLILHLDNDSNDQLTGFIVNEQKIKADKVYKAGESELDCIVLDIDREKKIVDLSERLYSVEESKASNTGAGKKKAAKQQTESGYQKAVVELNKEQYLVVTLRSDRSKLAVCLLQDLTAESYASYQKYRIGDEIEVKLVAQNQKQSDSYGRFLLAQPRLAT